MLHGGLPCGGARLLCCRSRGGADVIFGEEGGSALLGAMTLESLGPSLDPLRRELNPLPLILAGSFRKQ